MPYKISYTLKGADMIMIKGLLDTKTTIPSAKEIAKNTENAISNYAQPEMESEDS